MADYDFSFIDKMIDSLAYGDMTPEQIEKRESLLSQGFSYVTEPETPFTAPQTKDKENLSPTGQRPPQAAPAPFFDMSEQRNYNRYYRAALDFHKRNTPPRGDDDYWMGVANDMGEVSSRFGNDLFLMDLLVAVYSELERQFKGTKAL